MIRRHYRRSGVALLLVIATTALLSVLVTEIMFSSAVDNRISRNSGNRLQAYYLALSSARLSLLRLHMYKEVRNMMDSNSQIPIPKDIVDRIWSTPLPMFPLPGSKADWPGQITGAIEAEGSKIPINLLDGNVHRGSNDDKRKAVREEIKRLWNSQREDEEFDKLYRGIEADDLINALQDWIDADSNLIEGGDENRDYERVGTGYQPRNDRIPTLTEIRMVKGWTDDLYDRFAKHFSVLTNEIAVNPNHVPIARIKSWEPKLTLEDLAAIEKRRQLQPFAKMSDLVAFIQDGREVRNGRDFKLPAEYAELEREEIFTIDATGVVGDSRRTLKLGVRFISERVARAPGTRPNPGDSGGGSGGGAGGTGGGANPNPNPTPSPSAGAQKKGKLIEPYVVTIEEVL